jgi:phosphatidylethanolamine/phosphatidyl-N-methylethanolamine N-methyltransferase
MKMTNGWNRFIYRLWAPVYDALLASFFLPGRKRALELLALQPGERVLLVGVGTGADLPLLPEAVEATGVDISPEMLARANSRLPVPGCAVTLLLGDAQQLLVKEALFDAIIFNLILSVIPDGAGCLRENLRALKPDGRAVVFDKFLPENGNLGLGRRFLNVFSTLLGTDITRRFGDILSGSGWEIVRSEASILHGIYRVIILKRGSIMRE